MLPDMRVASPLLPRSQAGHAGGDQQGGGAAVLGRVERGLRQRDLLIDLEAERYSIAVSRNLPPEWVINSSKAVISERRK